MSGLVTNLKNSCKEFFKLRSLITAALLVALHTILALFVSIQVTESVRISISFICNVIIGAFFGPIMGFVCGGLGDIIQFLIKPTGAFNPGITLDACLAGFIYGLFFYGKFPKKIPTSESKHILFGAKKMLCNTISALLATGGIFVLLLNLPFASLSTKEGEVIYSKYSLKQALSYGFEKSEGRSVAIVGVILLVASCLLIVLSFLKNYVIPLAVSTIAIFTSILVMYTDRKTTSVGLAFYIIIAILGVYFLFALWRIAYESDMDIPFLIRCIICLTVDTALVNIFLGTFWISKLIGTPYWVLFIPRLVKNLVQLPINIILTYYVLYFAKKALPQNK